MSIQTEINRITGIKSDIANAITAKGGTVGANPTVAELAAAVAAIQKLTVKTGTLTSADFSDYVVGGKTYRKCYVSVNCGFRPKGFFVCTTYNNSGSTADTDFNMLGVWWDSDNLIRNLGRSINSAYTVNFLHNSGTDYGYTDDTGFHLSFPSEVYSFRADAEYFWCAFGEV